MAGRRTFRILTSNQQCGIFMAAASRCLRQRATSGKGSVRMLACCEEVLMKRRGRRSGGEGGGRRRGLCLATLECFISCSPLQCIIHFLYCCAM